VKSPRYYELIQRGPLEEHATRQSKVIQLNEIFRVTGMQKWVRLGVAKDTYFLEDSMGTPEKEMLAPPRTFAERAVWTVASITWKLISFPVLALLVILEPVARLLLAGLALLLTLTAFFLKLVMPPVAHAPFWGLLALAVGCVAALTLYYAALRILSA
jgi:hypothetical protein